MPAGTSTTGRISPNNPGSQGRLDDTGTDRTGSPDHTRSGLEARAAARTARHWIHQRTTRMAAPHAQMIASHGSGETRESGSATNGADGISGVGTRLAI